MAPAAAPRLNTWAPVGSVKVSQSICALSSSIGVVAEELGPDGWPGENLDELINSGDLRGGWQKEGLRHEAV